jgi:double-strand break repair protein MRE11
MICFWIKLRADHKQEGHLAALDILQMSGLINYYGRTPESDNIQVKPVLLQKGNTKLALYGISNVRDERLFRTWRDGGVKFFQPGVQKDDWFNILSIHQNHHAYSDTNYVPENFLPDLVDLVVWGHEHKCEIEPRTNHEGNFRVMQPGSSVATSLVEGEAEPKHVAILSINGKDCDSKKIRLKTVRPFKYKDIALNDSKQMREIAYNQDNRTKVHAYLTEIVEEMIEEAKTEWFDLQRESGEKLDEDTIAPLPLIRLRVETTAPEGGKYEIENPQRFSNRFVDKVANSSDVIQTHRKRVAGARSTKAKADLPDADTMAQLSIDNIKVDKLVREFLSAQSLTILPQNQFSESVSLFVDKDDKTAMAGFVDDSLDIQNKQLLDAGGDDVDEELTAELMEKFKEQQEAAYSRGEIKRKKRKGSRKEKPENWDSDEDGSWEDNPASIIRSDHEDEGVEEGESRESSVVPTTGRGRGRGRGGRSTAGTTRKTAAAAKKAPAKLSAARSRRKQVSEDEEEEEEEDVVMLDDEDEDDDEGLFVRPAKKTSASKATASRTQKAPAKTSARGGKTAAASRGGKQSQLSFASQANGTSGRATGGRAAAPKRLQEPSEDEISDDDAFEPPPTAARRGRR